MDKATKARLRSTELKDRTLWFDGDSSFDAGKLLQFAQKYDVKYVDSMNDTVREFNRHVSAQQEIKVKEESRPLEFDWTLPERYQKLDVLEHLMTAHMILTEGMDQEEADARDFRLISEIAKYKKLGLLDVLRAIIWIINTLTVNNIVWGVGRGSSVSSYVLYVIGVHDVDSHAYDLDIDDFLHD
jgi:DNA polymerase III alpha subunit